jgi:molecular chaperone DnaK/molecular chaperone HscA
MMDAAVSGAMRGKTMQSAGDDLGQEIHAPHPFAKADIDDSQLPNTGSTKIEPAPRTEENPEEDQQ